MAPTLHRLIHMSSAEVANLAEETRREGNVLLAVLPVGSIEQHGPLLPLGTDSMLAEGVGEAIATLWSKRTGRTPRALLLPCWHFTNADTGLGFVGTASVAHDALRAALISFVGSILRLDVAALVLLNGHGPNDPLLNEIAFRFNSDAMERGRSCPPTIVASIPVAMGPVYQNFGEPHGRHADWLEVALLLYLYGNALVEGRGAAFERHAKAHGPTTFPLVGIPIGRRGSEGVLGKGWLASRDHEELSKSAWNVFFPEFVKRLDADLAGAGAYLWSSTWSKIAEPRLG